MRKLLLILAALLAINASMDAKKVKVKMSPQQKAFAKQHKKAVKKMQKARKAPKHRQVVHQRVN